MQNLNEKQSPIFCYYAEVDLWVEHMILVLVSEWKKQTKKNLCSQKFKFKFPPHQASQMYYFSWIKIIIITTLVELET